MFKEEFKEFYVKRNKTKEKKSIIRSVNRLFESQDKYTSHKEFVVEFLKSIDKNKFHENLVSREITKFLPALGISYRNMSDEERSIIPEDYRKFANWIMNDDEEKGEEFRTIVRIPESMSLNNDQIQEFLETYEGKYYLYRQLEQSGEIPEMGREFLEIKRSKRGKCNRIIVTYKRCEEPRKFEGTVLITKNNLTCLLAAENSCLESHTSTNINLHTSFIDREKLHLCGMMNHSGQNQEFRACRVIVRKDNNAEIKNVGFLGHSSEAIRYFTAVYNEFAHFGRKDSNFLVHSQGMKENLKVGKAKAPHFDNFYNEYRERVKEGEDVSLWYLNKELQKYIE